MSSVLNMNHAFFIYFRPYILISFRRYGKRGKYIQGGNRFCRLLDPLDFAGDGIPDFAENVIFQGI